MPAPVDDVDADVVIVGAGLAGLCCARATVAAGLETVVLEAGDAVGGRVRSDVVDGHRLDRGFQILLTGYPDVRATLDLDALDLCRFDPGSKVWTGSSFQRVADPFRQPGALLDTARSDVGSIADKVKIARLRRRLLATPAVRLLQAPDRSALEALEAEGFSSTVIDRFFRPLLGGIQLDADLASSARMSEIIFRTLAIGDAAVPAHGMQAIPEQLASAIPDGIIRTSTPVERLAATAAVLVDGTRVTGRALVVATEGPVAARLLGLADPGSKPVSALWFTAPEAPIAGRSILLDGVGGGPVLNLAVMSEVAPSYAPAGRSLIAAACPGPVISGLEAEVRRQMRGWFGSAVDSWDLLRRDDIAHGQPLARVPFDPKRRVSLGDGRFVAGDHRDTPSIQGAMFSGRRCGSAVVGELCA